MVVLVTLTAIKAVGLQKEKIEENQVSQGSMGLRSSDFSLQKRLDDLELEYEQNKQKLIKMIDDMKILKVPPALSVRCPYEADALARRL